jgi:hypothetical protein
MDQGIYVIFGTAVKSSIFEKYTTYQNPVDKGCAFKDFILDHVQRVTDPSERDEKGSRDNESLATASTALTTPPPK